MRQTEGTLLQLPFETAELPDWKWAAAANWLPCLSETVVLSFSAIPVVCYKYFIYPHIQLPVQCISVAAVYRLAVNCYCFLPLRGRSSNAKLHIHTHTLINCGSHSHYRRPHLARLSERKPVLVGGRQRGLCFQWSLLVRRHVAGHGKSRTSYYSKHTAPFRSVFFPLLLLFAFINQHCDSCTCHLSSHINSSSAHTQTHRRYHSTLALG